VTVPGKGGRPRKWRSDADRVRAYRARQAGRDEPPELADALANGDELARAMEEIRALRAELVATGQTEQALRQELRSLRRDLAARIKRFGWLEGASEAQRTAREAAERERDALARDLAELQARLRVAISGTRPNATPSPARPAPSRAERRRQEREQQRRRD
jgi:chromosome segregation ATPase